MSRWGLYVRDWLDALFEKHDDAYLAEKLARAVEEWGKSRQVMFPVEVRDALREYRARNPRGDA